jgi:hypothetical protein
MPDRFVTVGTFTLAYEAELARNLLEAEGIRAILGGEIAGGMLPTGEIQLQVPDRDAARATGVLAAQAAGTLDEDWEEQAEAGVWTCSICGEPVAEDTAVCHSCRTPRDAICTATGRPPEAIRPPQEEIVTTPAPAPVVDAPEEVREEVADATPPAAAGDELARRALRTAVLALPVVVLVPLAWWYLFRLLAHPGELGPTGMRSFAWAVALNGLTALTWITFFLWAR